MQWTPTSLVEKGFGETNQAYTLGSLVRDEDTRVALLLYSSKQATPVRMYMRGWLYKYINQKGLFEGTQQLMVEGGVCTFLTQRRTHWQVLIHFSLWGDLSETIFCWGKKVSYCLKITMTEFYLLRCLLFGLRCCGCCNFHRQSRAENVTLLALAEPINNMSHFHMVLEGYGCIITTIL